MVESNITLGRKSKAPLVKSVSSLAGESIRNLDLLRQAPSLKNLNVQRKGKQTISGENTGKLRENTEQFSATQPLTQSLQQPA